ncbi:adenylate/guanylate cyclase domain-containing protein [Oceanobacter mangrovi]|uniref:adenylate/guanylate cyclase domain-containing protein n=1 Tax=Oceanobacter mangrovi TaxID=2862510 RepID=UPI001C8E2334|nr:adenylate/guanylate cyclase domain-containing protein [Oceanobacter mangrovi]
MSKTHAKPWGLSQFCGIFGALQILILGSVISFLTYSQLHGQLQASQQQRASQQLDRLAQLLAPSLLQQDRISINLALKEWNRGDDLNAIRIQNTDRKVIAETGPLLNPDQVINRSITLDDTAMGMMQAEINPQPVSRQSGRYLSLALMATGLCAMLGGLISYFMAERIAAYLRKLSGSLGEWNNRNLLTLPQLSLPIRELQELDQSCNQLQEQERQRLAIERALGKYLCSGDKPPVKTSTYHRCALVYIEITDLDVLQARLSAVELAETLGEYYRLLNQAAKLYNGKLDRYQGNGLVMIFGLNESSDRDTLHCIYAAQLCLGLLQQSQKRKPALASVGFRIAAHWGPVLLAPIEQDEDTHYSLIGDTIYWASHLAGSSEEGRLLASQILISELPPEYGLSWEEGPLVSDLQGNEQSSFWLQGLPETSRTLIERQIKHITSMKENA